MGSTYKPVSAHTYKGMEVEIRSILLPRGADSLAITAKDIHNATHRILQSDKTPMTKTTLSRLRDMTKQRRAVFNQFCEGGSLCHGHLYWIELWESVHKALLDHFNFVTSRDTTTMMEPLTKGPSDASLRDILTRLNEEAGRPDRSDELYTIANAEALHDRPTIGGGTGSGHGEWKHHPKTSFNQVHEEVLLGTSLDCIREIGDWLKTIWRDVAGSRLDFATVAHVNHLIDLPHAEHLTDDGIAVSNRARDLVRREYHEIDLLYGWTKHPIFQQHPLAQEIENVAEAAAWQEIISYQHINKAFEAPVLRDISNDKPELKDVVSIDRWLVLCTTEA